MSALPPVQVKPVPRTRAADDVCPEFLAALPQKLAGQGKRRTSTPNQYYLAWGNPTIIVHCGVQRPAKFVVGGPDLVHISPPNGEIVQWFQQPVEAGVTWTAVDRKVYVSVFVPEAADTTGILQDVGKALTKIMPARPIHPAPLIHPPR